MRWKTIWKTREFLGSTSDLDNFLIPSRNSEALSRIPGLLSSQIWKHYRYVQPVTCRDERWGTTKSCVQSLKSGNRFQNRFLTWAGSGARNLRRYLIGSGSTLNMSSDIKIKLRISSEALKKTFHMT